MSGHISIEPITIDGFAEWLANQDESDPPQRITTEGDDPEIEPRVYGEMDERVIERLEDSPWPSVMQKVVDSVIADEELTEYDLWEIMKATNGQVATGHYSPKWDAIVTVIYHTPHKKMQLADTSSTRRAGLPVLSDHIYRNEVKTVLVPIEARTEMDGYEE